MESDKNYLDDFQARCKSIINVATTHYQEFAHQYDKAVYEKVQKELIAALVS